MQPLETSTTAPGPKDQLHLGATCPPPAFNFACLPGSSSSSFPSFFFFELWLSVHYIKYHCNQSEVCDSVTLSRFTLFVQLSPPSLSRTSFSLRLKPCTYETIALSSSYFGFSDHLPLQAGTVPNSNPQLTPPSFLTREMRNSLPFVPNPPNPSGRF